MKTISNEQLTIQVSPHAAELCSIFANGKEYLWQADPAFWKRHSPVLFPIVGSVWENQYRNEGIAYTLSQHGFARDMEFTLVSEKKTKYDTTLSVMKRHYGNFLSRFVWK